MRGELKGQAVVVRRKESQTANMARHMVKHCFRNRKPIN